MIEQDHDKSTFIHQIIFVFGTSTDRFDFSLIKTPTWKHQFLHDEINRCEREAVVSAKRFLPNSLRVMGPTRLCRFSDDQSETIYTADCTVSFKRKLRSREAQLLKSNLHGFPAYVRWVNYKSIRCLSATSSQKTVSLRSFVMRTIGYEQRIGEKT